MKLYSAGVEIDVSEAEADFFLRRGYVEVEAPEEAPLPTDEELEEPKALEETEGLIEEGSGLIAEEPAEQVEVSVPEKKPKRKVKNDKRN